MESTSSSRVAVCNPNVPRVFGRRRRKLSLAFRRCIMRGPRTKTCSSQSVLTPVSAPSSDGSAKSSPSSPTNRAMAALRRWQPEFKGGSPLDNSQSPSPCGNHERAMMVACLGSCAAGTTLGFSSAAMPSIEHEPWYKLPHSYPENRWGEAVFLLGASGGALLSGFLLRFAGNRKTLLLSAFGLLCAWVGLMSCNSIAAFMASRVACGLWLGVTANSALVYVTDVAPPTKRAFFGGLTEVALGAGTLAASTLESARWELQATVCAVWPVMVFALQHYLVESPRWLHDRGSRQEANIAAARLFGIDLPPELRAKKEGEPVHSYRCLKQIRLVWACLLVNVLQNLSFAPLFLLRALQVLGSLIGEFTGSAVAVLLLAAYVSLGAFFAFQTSAVGRRWLLGFSALLVAATVFALRPLEYLVFSKWTIEKQPKETNWRGVLSVGLLVLCYSVGLCQVPPLLTGELMPLRMRYVGCSFMSASRWLGTGLLLHFDGEVVEAVRYQGSFLAFTLVYLVVTATALVMIPETEGRALADIAKDS